jgi:hypothetical protein
MMFRTLFVMLAGLFLAQAALTNEADAACSMSCCLGTWSSATPAVCTINAAATITFKAKRAATAGVPFHRCYKDQFHTNGCHCQCATAAADFTGALYISSSTTTIYTPPPTLNRDQSVPISFQQPLEQSVSAARSSKSVDVVA